MKAIELAAHVTILVLVCIGIGAAIYTRCSRKREGKPAESTMEEAHPRPTTRSVERINPISPRLPLFKTRSSLSMSSNPSSPCTPNTARIPGIRFKITPPSQRSRKSGSIDSLPSVETVLEQYEREADAAERSDRSEHNRILKDEDLGAPGPSIVEEKPFEEKKSAWDRPLIVAKTAGEA